MGSAACKWQHSGVSDATAASDCLRRGWYDAHRTLQWRGTRGQQSRYVDAYSHLRIPFSRHIQSQRLSAGPTTPFCRGHCQQHAARNHTHSCLATYQVVVHVNAWVWSTRCFVLPVVAVPDPLAERCAWLRFFCFWFVFLFWWSLVFFLTMAELGI